VVDFINSLNDPIQAVVIPVLWMIVLLLFRWFLQAVFLGLAVASSSAVWLGIEKLVGRPRMTTAQGICVHRNIAAYSFPSGHVIHDTVLYGFLLYLSFTPPVRRWRYRWVLIPFRILAVLYIIAVGYSRLEAGEHRLVDVLGGYLVGLLWLFLFIFLYRWVSHLLAVHRTKKRAEKSQEPFSRGAA
jgi:undecaprenyl-diphosphatase